MDLISIIICCRNVDIPNDLKKNIKNTIGSGYELIVIDNSDNKYSIFSAYNEGLNRASGNILCYMHEDVFYHSKNWGKNVLEYFLDYPQVAMIGVAGTHFLPKRPAAWWDTEMRSGHLLQGEMVDNTYRRREDVWQDYKCSPTKVVSVDGLWMCFRREIFDYIQWDDTTFKGFHGYDTDICLQVWRAGFEVHVCWNILIEHKSTGVANEVFYKELDVLYEKWKDMLPVIKGVELSKSEQVARERIVELRHEIYNSNLALSRITKSREYRWGQYLFNPAEGLKSVLSHIRKKL